MKKAEERDMALLWFYARFALGFLFVRLEIDSGIQEIGRAHV